MTFDNPVLVLWMKPLPGRQPLHHPPSAFLFPIQCPCQCRTGEIGPTTRWRGPLPPPVPLMIKTTVSQRRRRHHHRHRR